MATLSHHHHRQPSHSPTLNPKTYSELICEAIEHSPGKRLTLSEIYTWMIENVPHCHANAGQAWNLGWKNTVRHNLSQHREFKRIPIQHKHSYWHVDYKELEHQQRKRKQLREEPVDEEEGEGRTRAKSFCYGAAKARDIQQRVRTKSLGENAAPTAMEILCLQQTAASQEETTPRTPKVEVEPIDETVAEDWEMLTQLLNEVQLVNPQALKLFDSMFEEGLELKCQTIIEAIDQQETEAN